MKRNCIHWHLGTLADLATLYSPSMVRTASPYVIGATSAMDYSLIRVPGGLSAGLTEPPPGRVMSGLPVIRPQSEIESPDFFSPLSVPGVNCDCTVEPAAPYELPFESSF